MHLVASSILTLAGLGVLGLAVAAAYVLLVLRRPAGPVARPAPPAPPPAQGVSVRAVVDRLARVGDDETVFLDRSTGRFVTLADEVLADLESGESFEDDAGDFSRAELEALRRKLRAKVLVQLPTKAETKEFLLRERFCEGLPEGEAREQMAKVMRGQTGYRSFDAAVDRLGIAEQWRGVRDAAFTEIATAWLRRHGLPCERDAA